MSCTASPGQFCSPLYNRPIICPEDWYCPGGVVMAQRCPDSRWSAVGSIYSEDCHEHMNVGLAVVFVLFFMLPILSACIWCASWEWIERNKTPYYYVDPLYSGVYSDEASVLGGTRSTYSCD